MTNIATLSFTPAEFFRVYSSSIADCQANNAEYSSKFSADVVAGRMMAAILKNARTGGTNDWIKYNAALKSTAKLFGWSKSMELRAAFVLNADALDTFLIKIDKNKVILF